MNSRSFPRPYPLLSSCMLPEHPGMWRIEKCPYRHSDAQWPAVPGLVSFACERYETGVSTARRMKRSTLKVVKSGKSGAVVGSHKVWVSRPREPFVEPSEKEETAKLNRLKKKAASTSAKPPVDLAEILKKYGNLDKSPLTKEVKGGEPMDLKLD